jgi:hypothetical protein
MRGMDRTEHEALMRAALARGDGGPLVGLLTQEAWPVNVLQLIGDGLLAALAVSATCASEIHRR